MAVAGGLFRCNFKHGLEMIDAFPVEIVVLHIGQLADVLTDIGLVVADDAEVVFHFCPAGEDILGRLAQEDGNRRIAAGPPQQPDLAVHDPGHRIIDSGDDVPVVKEKKIGQAMEPSQGLLVAGADRLVAAVAAGHHQGQGRLRLIEQQMVQAGCRAASGR